VVFHIHLHSSSILFVAGLNSLEDRRHNLSRSFFQSISQPDSCLHHLFPPLRDVISRLRSTTPYPRPPSRTKNTNNLLTLHLIITSHLLLLRFTSSYHYSLHPTHLSSIIHIVSILLLSTINIIIIIMLYCITLLYDFISYFIVLSYPAFSRKSE